MGPWGWAGWEANAHDFHMDACTVRHVQLLSPHLSLLQSSAQWPLPADLVALLQASSAPLVQLLAAEMERGQERRGSQTVGARFRDQLRDLIQRLDT